MNLPELSEGDRHELRKALGGMPRMFRLVGAIFSILGEAMLEKFPELDEPPEPSHIELGPSWECQCAKCRAERVYIAASAVDG